MDDQLRRLAFPLSSFGHSNNIAYGLRVLGRGALVVGIALALFILLK